MLFNGLYNWFLAYFGKEPPMTPEEKEAQRRSFAFGNVAIDNPNVTPELVNQVTDRMKQPICACGSQEFLAGPRGGVCQNIMCDKCGKPITEYDEEEDCDMVVSCCVCRGKHVTDEQLLQFFLKREGLTHKQAVALYKKENKAKGR